MNKLNFLENFTQAFLNQYNTEFERIAHEVDRSHTITSNYLKYEKGVDSWPLQRYYGGYNFLNQSTFTDKNKFILVYSIYRYVLYLKQLESMNLKKEYFLVLFFDMDDELFLDSAEVMLFPEISYHISNSLEGSLDAIDLHEDMDIAGVLPTSSQFFRDILEELGIADYFILTEYNFYGHRVVLDTNFKISDFKKTYSELLK